MKVHYYAVPRGRMPGIYNNWAAAHKQVCRFRYGELRRFCCWDDCFNYLMSQKLTRSDLEFDCGKQSVEKSGDSKKFYAVAAGRITGLYNLWNDINYSILGFKGAKWKVFACRRDADDYLKREGLCSYRTVLSSKVETSDPLEDMKFSMDISGKVQVYVDGEFLKNGINGPAAGIGVWFGYNHPLNLSAPVEGFKVSNVIAQIQAVIAACRIAIEFGIKKLEMYTDSEYIVEYMIGWWNKLVENGFNNLQGKPVENADLLLELRRVLEKVDVFFHLVAPNSGIKGNIEADQLAKAGVKMYVKQYKKEEKK